MKRRKFVYFAALVIVAQTLLSGGAFSQTGTPLKLVQTIELANIRSTQPESSPEQLAQNVRTTRMPGLPNHFDHLTADLKNDRLFVVPEDNKSVEVYGLHSGKFIHSMKEIGVGHSVLYRADVNRIFVTDGTDGALKIFDGSSYDLLKTVKLLTDADAVAYDPGTHYLYIANGGLDAKLNYCLLSIVDTSTGRHVGDIKIESNRLEAMVLEKSGPRLFLNMTGNNEIGVIDRGKQAVVATWAVVGGRVNAAVAIDEARHRLFVACRDGNLVVLDSDTGKGSRFCRSRPASMTSFTIRQVKGFMWLAERDSSTSISRLTLTVTNRSGEFRLVRSEKLDCSCPSYPGILWPCHRMEKIQPRYWSSPCNRFCKMSPFSATSGWKNITHRAPARGQRFRPETDIWRRAPGETALRAHRRRGFG